MKYVWAFLSAVAIFIAYSILMSALGFRYGGGAIPMVLLMASIGFVWRRIIGNPPTRHKTKTEKDVDTEVSEANDSSTDLSADASPNDSERNLSKDEAFTIDRNKIADFRKAYLSAVDEVEKRYNVPTVKSYTSVMRQVVKNRTKELADQIGTFDLSVAREWAYSTLSNFVGDELESGKFHVYRGVLGMEGETLLNVFDSAYEVLVSMSTSDVDDEYANQQKQTIRQNIKAVG